MPFYQWVFGGIGAAVPVAAIGWFFQGRRANLAQSQKGGNGSVQVQAGGNISTGTSAEKSSGHRSESLNQKQIAGDESVQFQAGGDANLPDVDAPEPGMG